MSVDCGGMLLLLLLELRTTTSDGFHALFIDAYRKLGKYDLKPGAFVVGTRTSTASVTGNFTL
jgi:hypothetical protein